MENVKVNIVLGYSGRWIIVRADDPSRAWSGSAWVVHYEGTPARIPVSHFITNRDALIEAACAGFRIGRMS